MKHDAWLKEQLQDPGFAAEYLAAAAQDAEPAVYLAALRKVAESRAMAQVAASAGIPRESLVRALSARGNPRWSTWSAIRRATGMTMAVRRGVMFANYRRRSPNSGRCSARISICGSSPSSTMPAPWRRLSTTSRTHPAAARRPSARAAVVGGGSGGGAGQERSSVGLVSPLRS